MGTVGLLLMAFGLWALLAGTVALLVVRAAQAMTRRKA
jgi:hypothetical protein